MKSLKGTAGLAEEHKLISSFEEAQQQAQAVDLKGVDMEEYDSDAIDE